MVRGGTNLLTVRDGDRSMLLPGAYRRRRVVCDGSMGDIAVVWWGKDRGILKRTREQG